MTPSDAEALVEDARREDDGDRRWELLVSATRAGPGAVRQLAERLLASEETTDLALGADLVSAMPSLTAEEAARMRARGWPIPDVAPFGEDDRTTIAALLERTLTTVRDPNVVQPCVIAAGKLQRPELLDAILSHLDDADPDVREACAWSLNKLEPEGPSERAVAALVALADDPVGFVRDWALTGLGGNGIEPIDTPETRRVFRAHVEDSDRGAREEAIQALGLLGDVEMLALALSYDMVSSEAVELAAKLRDPRLHQPLVDLRTSRRDLGRSGDFDDLLSEAIDATTQ